jgi:photosystem II stability/assembly factor-like uncharacterized protein
MNIISRAIIGGLIVVTIAALLVSAVTASDTEGSVPTREALFGIAAVESAESTTLYAVGARGLLLASTDQGRTWALRKVKTSLLSNDYDLLDIRFASDGRDGWIVGEHGTVLRTANAGRSWVPQQSGTTSRLFAVAAVSSDIACAVGSHGVLLRTTDGGVHWLLQHFRDTTFFSVTFANQKNGWAVGEFETILHTADGGISWQVQSGGGAPSHKVPPYFAVAFTDALHGWVTGIAGALSTTQDGGEHWQSKSIAVPGSASIFSIAPMPTADTIWFGGQRGTLFRFNGDKWEVRPTATLSDLTDLTVVAGTLIGVGMDGTIIRVASAN